MNIVIIETLVFKPDNLTTSHYHYDRCTLILHMENSSEVQVDQLDCEITSLPGSGSLLIGLHHNIIHFIMVMK